MTKAMYAKVAGAWQQVYPHVAAYNKASGGTVRHEQIDGVWWTFHDFKASGTLNVVKNERPFRVLMVAGGGGGHNRGAGGGGEVIDTSTVTLPTGDVGVIVGDGGALTAAGTASAVGPVVANPGGASPGHPNYSGGVSGSGKAGGSATALANDGGWGGAGHTASPTDGNGGAGVSFTLFGEVFNWGGGGGGSVSAGTQMLGKNGGGNGAVSPDSPFGPTNGAPNSGGGAGAWYSGTNGTTSGGSGRVLIGYEDPTYVPPPFNDATGGTVLEFTKNGKKYRRHTFLSSGDFTVLAIGRPFAISIIGGAGRNGEQHDGFGTSTGGGGGYLYRDLDLALGTLPVVVGASTVASSFNGLVAGPGGNGAFRSWMDPCPAIPSLGTPTPEGDGGTCGVPKVTAARLTELGLPANIGQPGPGGVAANGGAYGGPGAVVIEYEIPVPPYNDATGGTITEVDNYLGSGEKWRVHTFTADSNFVVAKAVEPFKVLSVAGGGAGYTNNVNASGGGGGGEVIKDDAAVIPVGTHAVVVGDMGRWNGSTGNNATGSSIGGQHVARPGVNCATGGGGGASGNGNAPGGGAIGGGGGAGGPGSGQTGGPGVASDISGTNVTYGVGGSNTSSPGTPGSGGTALANNGFKGIAVIAYRIG